MNDYYKQILLIFHTCYLIKLFFALIYLLINLRIGVNREKYFLILKGNNINIKNSLIGVATKDSSKSKINILKIKNTELCAATYRKKQEFYGADMTIDNFLCDKNEIYYQNGSNLKIINEL